MKKESREWAARFILETVKLGGVMCLALVVPGVFELVKTRRCLKKHPRQRKHYVGKVLNRLIDKKLVKVSNDGFISLTPEGERAFAQYEMDACKIPEPKVWDGKYRVAIFDVPEEKRKIRHALRRQLVEWGFLRLQNSVWVFPYECGEMIGLIKTRFGIPRDVLYMTVDSIENDQWLKKEFGLA